MTKAIVRRVEALERSARVGSHLDSAAAYIAWLRALPPAEYEELARQAREEIAEWERERWGRWEGEQWDS